LDELVAKLTSHAPTQAIEILATQPDQVAVELLIHLNQSLVRTLLDGQTEDRRQAILAAAPADYRKQWSRKVAYPENSVGQLMRPPVGMVPVELSVAAAVEELRRLAAGRELITYLYAVDRQGRLEGVVVLRDLFLRDPSKRIGDIMIAPPFYLTPDQPLLDAMKSVVSRHYPVYPVCDAEKHLIGIVRGQALFEKQAFVISAQPGSMVGVRAHERLSTSWLESLRFRHPWLQLNLALSLLSAIVIQHFNHTISRLVILAAFLTVVAAQSRNTGAQAMAITIRGLSTGEWRDGSTWKILLKELSLGLLNGAAVGVFAGIVIGWGARAEGHLAWSIGAMMVLTMALGCAFSCACGVVIPIGLRVLRTDPALAATILHATLATVASQAIFLVLARWVLH
jgi:magnesium transporter